MAHYLDPKNDLIFKRVFGEHKHLCKSLLNSMLPLEASQQIVDLEYQQPELVPEIPALKGSIVDVHCTDNRGRRFIVEMQMYWTDSFKSRVLFNASKAYIKQLDSGKEYKFLQPVYALSFVNETFDSDPAVYYHDYKIVNIENREKQIEGLEFVFIELPKFRPGNRAEKKLYDLWLTFLTQINEGEETVPEALLEEEVTKEAVQYLERSSYKRDELDAYDRYWDVIRTERMYYLDALDEGLKKGMADGVAKGMADGMAKGMAEGDAIGAEKSLKNVILNAKRNKFSIAQIQDITNLSKEKIEEILRDIQ
ncbi:MAG: Rpn family recombination-promoting nuclease/putative transposase [Prevotellaceae bacterium]|jgi:predicted transposase/invertase (TIGR01784 family)|nr:Rpn family recombination-promoting nuclease/putative transposase [Prevotellaceae bacterium]